MRDLLDIVFIFFCCVICSIVILYIQAEIRGRLGKKRPLRIRFNKKATKVWANYWHPKKFGNLYFPSSAQIHLVPHYTESGLLHEFAHLLVDAALMTELSPKLFRKCWLFDENDVFERTREVLAWGLADRISKHGIDMDECEGALLSHGLSYRQVRMGMIMAMNTQATKAHIAQTGVFILKMLRGKLYEETCCEG